MGNTKNKGIYIELVSIEENKLLDCQDICNLHEDCYCIGKLECGTTSAKGIRMSHAYLIIQNISNKQIRVDPECFTAIDNDGFSYRGVDFRCDYYGNEKEFYAKNYELHPSSKVRFLVLFKSKTISQIIYDNNIWDEYHYKVIINDKKENLENIGILKMKLEEKDSIITNLEEELFIKSQEIKELKEELEDARVEMNKTATFVRENFNHQASMKRVQESMLCKYEFIEDSEYFRIISLEEEDTVSFNREFDKSKDNYSWINKNDALISLKADNAFGFSLDGRTIIKSPVSGIFEFDKNKMIGYKEEICRIRKYPQCEKENVISELEREEIKKNIYKKERKKMIERETLDELIEEGKIFNVYTKKEGNRSTIPMDIATAVWNRDGGKCCFCGSSENLEFDHIIPISKGGATTFRNLQLLCKNCNIKKSDNI
ncbi:HNH endonuclease [Bacteroides fragilis]|jgi:hypothetical protein|uniref:HNH endonuclease n=1 Tax=Bacteroides fragilis TaxID=817 RepID=UPI001C734D52|nr:HNH endonuclease [Bacteroides fragilis]